MIARRHRSRIAALILSVFLGLGAFPGASQMSAEIVDHSAPSGSEPQAGSISAAGIAESAPASTITRRGTISVDFLRHPITESVRRMLGKALETMKAGDHEGARDQLLKMLAKYPESAAYVHSLLGVENLRTARFDEAVVSFEQAALLLPHDAMTHYNFGLSLACVKDYDRAEQETNRALELDPKNASAQSLSDVLLLRKHSSN